MNRRNAIDFKKVKLVWREDEKEEEDDEKEREREKDKFTFISFYLHLARALSC